MAGQKKQNFLLFKSYLIVHSQIPYGGGETGLFLSFLACKDPKAPLPRQWGQFLGSVVDAFAGTGNTFGTLGQITDTVSAISRGVGTTVVVGMAF